MYYVNKWRTPEIQLSVYHAVWIVQGKNVLCTLRLVSNTLGEADNLRFRNIFKFDKSKC